MHLCSEEASTRSMISQLKKKKKPCPIFGHFWKPIFAFLTGNTTNIGEGIFLFFFIEGYSAMKSYKSAIV